MKIEVITIGNELLDGRRTDSNTTWIGHVLSQHGLSITYRQSVNDDDQDIQDALLYATRRSDIVVTTGGLGPTLDDITFTAAGKAAGQQLVFHAPIMDKIKQRYAARGLVAPRSNERQAWLPAEAKVLENEYGTAPGAFMQINDTPVFIFPGVPSE
ncbi:MAG: competence/damage-inducible protein A, partial [Deltaproteobacteria bacterium]|nr:competence/damage-inducible protein A [Deltaproteobacteria bacterium]